MMSNADQVTIAQTLSKNMSNSTGADYDDLFSEALSKLPVIQKNYIADVGGNFKAYLKSSLRGYLKNYIRDHSFTVKVPRRTLDIYMRTRRYSSHLIASIHTKWSEDEIRQAHETVRKHRSYNTNEVQSWSIVSNSLTATNEFKEAMEICAEAAIDGQLLCDFYVNELSKEEMISKYGKTFMRKVNKQTKILKQVAIDQGYNEQKY